MTRMTRPILAVAALIAALSLAVFAASVAYESFNGTQGDHRQDPKARTKPKTYADEAREWLDNGRYAGEAKRWLRRNGY